MKNKTVCFTGHRKIPTAQYIDVSQRLNHTIIDLIEDGYSFFGVGGALGFDTIAAQTILELRTIYPHIKLILVLPCITQSNKWCENDKKRYEEIRQAADKVIYTSKEYTEGCMYKRNRHLVNNSSVCVCYLTENRGGTFYTVNYAKKKGLYIINLAE